MYRIKDSETKQTLMVSAAPRWVKQQENADCPIKCDSYEEADGVVFGDGAYMRGIEGRKMQNYTPTVIVLQESADVYLLEKMDAMESRMNRVEGQVNQVYDVQTYGTVPKNDLDDAYREGVNSYE